MTPLQGLADYSRRLQQPAHLDTLLDQALLALDELFGLDHTILLVCDDPPDTLTTLASHGYSQRGAGAEVRVGDGLIGVVAERQRPARIGNVLQQRTMGDAVREQAQARGQPNPRQIPLPGIPDVRSMAAVPLLAHGTLLGVLYAESDRAGQLREQQLLLLTTTAQPLALALARFREPACAPEDHRAPGRESKLPAWRVRYYASDDSCFIDDNYVIKSLPGRILWKLLNHYVHDGRSNFSNKELRLDPSLKLPAFKDNLETRLILLRRRLEDRFKGIRIVRTGRGRFSLEVDQSLVLEQV